MQVVLVLEQARDLVSRDRPESSFGVGNFCSRYWMMSLLSMCTAPSCTNTGTSPRGLMPRNHGKSSHWQTGQRGREVPT